MGPKEKQVQTVLTSGDFDFLQTLSRYVPSLVDSSQQSKEELPKVQAMDTIVLISDISGFTKVSEACTNQGIRGNEELAFVINRYMEGMVRNIRKYGGDVIKIFGDTMIVMWPEEKAPHDVLDSQKQQSYRNSVRKAIESALDIQNEINGFQVKSDVSSLSVKIGIGFSPCSLLNAGGVFVRAEFFTIGPALNFALKSEEMCAEGGQINKLLKQKSSFKSS